MSETEEIVLPPTTLVKVECLPQFGPHCGHWFIARSAEAMHAARTDHIEYVHLRTKRLAAPDDGNGPV